MTNTTIAVEEFTRETVLVWLAVSQLLFWLVLVIGTISLPLLCCSLVSLISYRRRSHCFPFLVCIIIGDLVMLSCICMTLLVERFTASNHGISISSL